MFLKKIDEKLNSVLQEKGLEKAWPFQKQIISRIKSGGDLIAEGSKGTGKATSIIIAITQLLKEAKDDVPRVMMVAPSPERVKELKEMFNEIAGHTNLRIHLAYEGPNIEDQKDKIYFGTDVVLGTPKRITQLMRIEGINFAEIRLLIIDSGEEALKFDSYTQISRISQSLEGKQKVISCAEKTDKIDRFSDLYLFKPLQIKA